MNGILHARWRRVCASCATCFLLAMVPSAVAQVPVEDFLHYSPIGSALAANNLNAISFRQNAIMTVGDQQFTTYYDANRTVAIARRTLGTDAWEVFDTGLNDPNSNATDDHNVISFTIDDTGVLHMSWGMHNNPLLYAKSDGPVTGTSPISVTSGLSMTGVNESAVTYPFYYNAPSGDLLFMYRTGSSGNGDSHISRYDLATGVWSPVLHPMFDGEVAGDGIPSVNAYPQTAVFDSQGNFHWVWTSRFNSDSPAGESGYQTNHNFFYARSPDEGATWTRMDGTPYTPIPNSIAPISEANAEVAIPIPEGSSIMNQSYMIVDNNDHPVLANWWSPGAQQGDHTRQYMLGWYDGTQWQTSQITDRPTESKKNESFVRDLARPIVMVDDEDRTIVAMRYKERGHVVTVAYSSDRQNWDFIDLNAEHMGEWEPTFDLPLWERENKLHLLYQPVENGESVNTIQVLEWDAASYFEALGDALKLRVNRSTGQAALMNESDETILLDGYTIRTDKGTLSPAEWSSLQSQGYQGWEEANPSSSRLNELFASGDYEFAAGANIPLGNVFSAGQVAFGQDAPSDLAFRFTASDGSSRAGLIEYVGESTNNLVITVDPETGRARFLNGSQFSVAIDGYSIASESGSLNYGDSGWISFSDQGALDGDWDESNRDADRVAELLPEGFVIVAPGETIELGLLLSSNGQQDLQFEFLQEGESVATEGLVFYAEAGVPGDFNDDGSVDAIDYAVWREALGTETTLANDLTPGSVSSDDYQVWKSFYGFNRQPALPAGQPTPEPTSCFLAATALCLIARRR